MRFSKLAPYLNHLKALPFVRDLRLDQNQKNTFFLDLLTPTATARFTLVYRSIHLSHEATQHLLDSHKGPLNTLILATPSIGAPLGKTLRENDVCYVDRQGNCSIVVGEAYMALIEGRTAPPRPIAFKGIRAAGCQVLFSYLAEPELVGASLREVAKVAGVSRQAVMDARNRLVHEGILVKTGRSHRWFGNGREVLMNRWLVNYSDILRPSISVGQFRTPDNSPLSLEKRLLEVLGEQSSWFYGGSAAGHRLTETYRGSSTIIHIDEATDQELPKLLVELKAIPDTKGPLVVLRTFGPLSKKGVSENTVHPLLIYSEMMNGEERAREAAEDVFSKYIEES